MGKPNSLDWLLRRVGDAAKANAPGVLAARRRIVDNQVVPGSEPAARVQWRGDYDIDHPGILALAQDLASAMQDPRLRDAGLSVRGSYQPIAHMMPGPVVNGAHPIGIASYRPRDIEARRHEVMHGYNHAASLGIPGAPLASRVIAPFHRTAIYPVLDELVAQSAGGVRFQDMDLVPYADHYWRNRQLVPFASLRAAQGAQWGARHSPEIATGLAVGGAATAGAAQVLRAIADAQEPSE